LLEAVAAEDLVHRDPLGYVVELVLLATLRTLDPKGHPGVVAASGRIVLATFLLLAAHFVVARPTVDIRAIPGIEGQRRLLAATGAQDAPVSLVGLDGIVGPAIRIGVDGLVGSIGSGGFVSGLGIGHGVQLGRNGIRL
jgi:hypothetical protein